MVNVVRRQSLVEQAAEAILSRVASGEWGLGARLPGETRLAAQLGVGRSTVREAVRELVGHAVLESRQGSGVFVVGLERAEDWPSVLARADAVSVIEARIGVEAEAAALAARRRTPADLRALRRTLRERSLTGPEVEAHVRADMAFHRAVVLAAHNEVFTELFDAFVPRVHRSMVEMLRVRPLPSAEADHTAHELLFEAIRARDAVAAAEASRTHLRNLREQYA
ncbi:FadR/GntR family transcriptional regulator (plasmid) [Streptomyces sp. BI20]|uniref:FadR/GntR family transcriptional regulator n=1 Tax=Streptomyces sp. BI20 TaxID=3403460 RepID=UPI003C70F475